MKADLPIPPVARTDRPLVSILVKALNESANIERCVRSCLSALEGIDGEVIVADSKSDDDTVAIALRFPVRVVQLERRSDRSCGVAAQMAYGHATGRFVYIIDGDMELPAAFLREAIALLESRPELAGVGGQLEERHPSADLARLRAARPRRRLHGEVDRLNGGGLYRREAIEAAGDYLTHPGLHANEELELALRLRHAGWKLWRTESTSMCHSGHTDAAFSLLGRRWRSKYAFGSGELLRSSLGKPYLREVFDEFRVHLLVWACWLTLLVALLLTPISPWIPVAAIAVLLAPIAIMAVRKRSFFLGSYAVVAWHVFAAGAIVGFVRMRVSDPKQLVRSCLMGSDGKATLPAEALSGDSGSNLASEDGVDVLGDEKVLAANARPKSMRTANPYGGKAVRKGMANYLTGRLYSGVVSLLIISLYVRYMTVQDYAAYTTLSAVGHVVALLSLLGMDRAAMRYFPAARISGSVEALRHVVRTLSFVRIAVLMFVAVVVILLSGPILTTLQLGGQTLALVMAMLFLLAHSTAHFQGYTLQSLMLQRQLTLGLIVGLTARAVLVLLIIWQFGSITTVLGLAAMAAAEWLQVVMQWNFYRIHTNTLARELPPPTAEWKPSYKEIFKYALLNYHSTAMRQLTGSATLRLIGATYLPPVTIAAYGLFQALADRARVYLPVFLGRTLIEPVAMARYLRDQDFQALSEVLSVALKLNLLVLLPLIGWLALGGDPVLGLLTGGKYLEYRWVLLLSLVTLLPISHWALLELASNAVGASRFLARGSTLAAAGTVGFVVISQPWAGIVGLVLTTAVASSLANGYVINRLGRAGYKYRVDVIGVLRIAFNASLAAATGWALSWVVGGPSALAGSVVALVGTVAAFAGLNAFHSPLRGVERDLLMRMLPQRLRGVFSRSDS